MRLTPVLRSRPSTKGVRRDEPVVIARTPPVISRLGNGRSRRSRSAARIRWLEIPGRKGSRDADPATTAPYPQ